MRLPRVHARPRDPLLLDREVDVAFAVLWGIYSIWGFFATLLGVATITDAISETYTFLWATGIGIFAGLSCLAATSLFFDFGGSLTPPLKKRIELWAVRVLGWLIAVYPALLTLAAFAGDHNRGPSAVIACSYLVFPILRGRMLKKRIRSFEVAAKEIMTNGNA